MNHSAQRYRSKLKKKLPCMRKTRSKLLCEFDCMLNGFLDENPDASFNDLCNAFGPPDEMARILMAEISKDEVRQYRLRTKYNRILAGLCAIVFLVFTLFVFLFKEFRDMTFIEETYIGLPYEFTEGE